MYDPNDVPDNISGVQGDAPMETKSLDTNVRDGDQKSPLNSVGVLAQLMGHPYSGSFQVGRGTRAPRAEKPLTE